MSVEIRMNKIKRKLSLEKIQGQLQSLSLILFWKGSTALAYRLIKIFSFVMLHVRRKTTLRWKVTKLTCTVCVKLLSSLRKVGLCSFISDRRQKHVSLDTVVK